MRIRMNVERKRKETNNKGYKGMRVMEHKGMGMMES